MNDVVFGSLERCHEEAKRLDHLAKTRLDMLASQDARISRLESERDMLLEACKSYIQFCVDVNECEDCAEEEMVCADKHLPQDSDIRLRMIALIEKAGGK